MTCSLDDLKAYAVGELPRCEQAVVEDHVRSCQGCREELERLNLIRSALVALEDEDPPRRIAFVSDRVFEPRWWQTMWRSGPAMGFASAVLLAGAIITQGFVRRAAPAPAQVDTAQIEQRIAAQVSLRLNAAVTKAVNEAEAQQSAEFAKALRTADQQRKADLANFQQAADYYRMQMARFEMASNEGPAK